MNEQSEPEIVHRELVHDRLTYSFRWNKSHHRSLGHRMGDGASLWAHLSKVADGRVPEEPFNNLLYARASSLRLASLTKVTQVSLKNRLMKSGAIVTSVDDLVRNVREFHRARNDLSYCADHTILQDFIVRDPNTVAIEVPVWSDQYRLSGHIDLVRIVNNQIQVCDYKPGSLHTVQKRFFEALPQVSAYGEMMTHHLAATLRDGMESSLLPTVRCCVFDSHASWHFGADMFVKLAMLDMISPPIISRPGERLSS